MSGRNLIDILEKVHSFLEDDLNSLRPFIARTHFICSFYFHSISLVSVIPQEDDDDEQMEWKTKRKQR